MNEPIRHIAHLDLDCFFVSVERTRNPSLIGKPVAVGGTPAGRGVVASASYEARAFGVRSAMPMARALRLCPHLIVVQGHYRDYIAASDALYERMLDFAPTVERASIDEMYLDFTGTERIYHQDLEGTIRTLKKIVSDEFHLPCTISLASNKTVAKIATDLVKPDGLVVIPSDTEKAFLAPLPIRAIPGVGQKTEEYLKRKGYRTIADLQKRSIVELTDLLGKHGVWLHRVARGGGSITVHQSFVRKSIGNEETFSHDIGNREQLDRMLQNLVEHVCIRLRRKHWKTRTVTLKLRYSDFKTITRAETIGPTDDDIVIFQAAKSLLERGYTRKLPVRLLGVQLTNFLDEKAREPELFDTDDKRAHMFTAVDELRKKFGDEIIHVGRT